MRREIKFRFWDSELNKMIYRMPLTYDFSHPKITPMQFTGLKDKNGIEVYESDIVIVLNKPYECENSIVMWGKKSHGWSVKCKIIKNNAYDPLIKYYGLGSSYNIEVIGNIYEHPHLI